MLQKMPEYCKGFRCIANNCKDNCCIGWEIDIDDKTAGYYESVPGPFGEKLKNNIEKSEVCFFKLKDERCPFLNEKNLCEIILNLGEDKLCCICRDHPRYFEWYGEVKEGGIGLCCEEGARLIVNCEKRFSLYETECDDEPCTDYNTNLYDMLVFARDEIINTLEDEKLSLKNRIALVLSYTEKIQYLSDNYVYENLLMTKTYSFGKADTDLKSFLESFKDLEAIDGSWQNYLESLIYSADDITNKLSLYSDDIDRYLKNIAVYFIWRYFLKGVFDEEIISKVRLMAVSVAMIKLMYINASLSGENLNGEICSMLAKNYSKEIEYSEENLEKIYDMAYDNPAFSPENLLSII